MQQRGAHTPTPLTALLPPPPLPPRSRPPSRLRRPPARRQTTLSRGQSAEPDYLRRSPLAARAPHWLPAGPPPRRAHPPSRVVRAACHSTGSPLCFLGCRRRRRRPPFPSLCAPVSLPFAEAPLQGWLRGAGRRQHPGVPPPTRSGVPRSFVGSAGAALQLRSSCGERRAVPEGSPEVSRRGGAPRPDLQGSAWVRGKEPTAGGAARVSGGAGMPVPAELPLQP